MKILVTGAEGFIAKNLISHLRVNKDFEVFSFARNSKEAELGNYINSADFIFHLAGVNRPKNLTEFDEINFGLTKKLCGYLKESGKKTPIVFSSSIQAEIDNDYGRSKLAAEEELKKYSAETGAGIYIYRLPNVFGKWCKPNYNSVVATFCNNLANDLPIKINNPEVKLSLVYIDDVVQSFIKVIKDNTASVSYIKIYPEYKITVSKLAEIIRNFAGGAKSLRVENVGNGFIRAIYSTYISYLPPEKFSYELPKYEDERGFFAEILKTHESGQFSFFTIFPGKTRGGHYHHTKTEKFLVVKGKAKFAFRNLLNNEKYELVTEGELPRIVETIPGWVHDISNIGNDELIAMIWANEIFEREKPDTYAEKV